MPQRHSRNNNDLAVFTYEEKRKLGFGTQRERIGKDSMKPFDACCLCLKSFIEPLSCKKGHVFCKECIYSCLLQQKKDIKKKLALFDAQERQVVEDKSEKIREEKELQLEMFEKVNNSAVPVSTSTSEIRRSSSSGFQGANSVRTTSFEEESLRTMKAYWLPSATPQAPVKVESPSIDTVCPEGNEKIRIKDLFPIHFTPLPGVDSSKSFVTDRFMCPSCSSTLTNVSKISAVSTCGHVFCKKCADKFIAVDKACMVCSKPCKERSLVDLQQGGTGFAAHGDNVMAASFKHLGSGSGAAVLRPATRI